MFCKHVKKATIHISRRSNFKILRGSKVIDITSYPSLLVMSITFDLSAKDKETAPSGNVN